MEKTNTMERINPLQAFGSALCSVQNPSSYIGGEIGATVKPHRKDDGLFNVAIAFPDVYSIGMSNQAIKIIYNGLNARNSVRCERVFAVESDFESLLRQKDLPLYTLETGMPLHCVDLVGFSIGYELGITGVLNVLDLGRIPLLMSERTDGDPIVIAGGVGATNPAVFSAFFDAVFIGEAEGGLFDLIKRLAAMKKSGAARRDLLAECARHPSVWTQDMSVERCGHAVARRAVQADFGSVPSVESFFPLPNIKPVQDHGVVEIMRGCPNGCRFCHAGIYYRPQRVKSRELIFAEVDRLVNEAGYREISLTSLSSADYPDIGGLLDELNQRYRAQNVSFQLPSLKANSVTLPILAQLSEVRKSGLTFAVETPDEAWQLRLNKEVYAQHLVDIIGEAKKLGWNKAKFYFMVGLPFPETDGKTEESVIVDFLRDVQEKTGIRCNVNVGTFIPKPHTPYQWVRQISPEESERKLTYIREHLPRGKFKVSTHDVATSYLEGLLSRGDERAGKVIYRAYQKGCRLDAWEDHLRRNLPLWEAAFAEAGYDVKAEILRPRDHDEPLPWDSVSLGPAKHFYEKEWQKHLAETLTPKCAPNCDHRCGICNDSVSCKNTDSVYKNRQANGISSQPVHKMIHPTCNIPILYRVIFSFSKIDGGGYIAHLSLIEQFNRAILKSELPVVYTAGFNPLPRLEFASTLPLGITSRDEIASVLLYEPVSEQVFIDALNRHFVPGIRISRCFVFPVTNLRRRESLASGLWGSVWRYHFFGVENTAVRDFFAGDGARTFLQDASSCAFSGFGLRADGRTDTVQDKRTLTAKLAFRQERPFREALESFFGKKWYEFVSIAKMQTLAKPDAVSFFTLYERIAAINAELLRQREAHDMEQNA